jgi:hypothetical protein
MKRRRRGISTGDLQNSGYVTLLIPPMLTFVVPSKFYQKEFRKSVQQFRTTIFDNVYVLIHKIKINYYIHFRG